MKGTVDNLKTLRANDCLHRETIQTEDYVVCVVCGKTLDILYGVTAAGKKLVKEKEHKISSLISCLINVGENYNIAPCIIDRAKDILVSYLPPVRAIGRKGRSFCAFALLAALHNDNNPRNSKEIAYMFSIPPKLLWKVEDKYFHLLKFTSENVWNRPSIYNSMILNAAGLAHLRFKRRKELKELNAQANAFSRTTNKSRKMIMAILLMRIFKRTEEKCAIREVCNVSNTSMFRIRKLFVKFLKENSV